MKNPLPVVRVIVENPRHRILFLQRSNTEFEAGRYCLPGGKVDLGKTLEQMCFEEVKQETGLTISKPEFLFYDDTAPNNPQAKHFINFYFRAGYKGNIALNEESSTYVWVAQDELDRYDIVFRNDLAAVRYWELKNR